MMQLPGGINTDGYLKRSFCFKPVTGLLELTLSECAMRALRQPGLTHPQQVTNVLCETLETLADEPVSKKRVKALCVGDRQFLMRRLAIHIEDAVVWLTTHCGDCDESFDVSLRYSELPVKPAGEKFPETMIEIEQSKFKVRVPNGSDQECIAAIDNEAEATHVLLERLTSPVSTGKYRNSKALDVANINKDQIAFIESTVEQMAPEVATEVLATCPHCAIENRVPVSPYACMEQAQTQMGRQLYAEIHTLASNYHWSEHEILAMPRDRRHMYLGLIDHGRHMNSNNNIYGSTNQP